MNGIWFQGSLDKKWPALFKNRAPFDPKRQSRGRGGRGGGVGEGGEVGWVGGC